MVRLAHVICGCVGLLVGLSAASLGHATYDKFIDDPAVRKAAQDEIEVEVNKETLKKLNDAIAEKDRIENQYAAEVDALRAEIEQMKVETDDLIREFEQTDGAAGASGIDGRFLR